MTLEKNILITKIRQILSQVTDPEIPVLSIVDLGIIRDILICPASQTASVIENEQEVEVIITPTYSGCPAMDVIAISIKMALLKNGFKNIKITQRLSPAWTTDWITKTGKDTLRSYGIAPPQTRSDGPPSDRLNSMLFIGEAGVDCPQCCSKNTKLLSQFGSTACKALYQCNECNEPFDYFKCH